MRNSKGDKKPKKIKKASSFVFWILRIIFTPTLYLLYRFKFERESSKDIKRPCFILSNHQTVADQFFVSVGFKFGINYVATDSIFRHGLLSKIMIALVRPIPFSKGNSDLIAIRNMMSVIKDGGCVAMFPSGNRSCYGNESPIVPGIGKLAKKFNVPLVLVQLRGGFNTQPRWKEKPSKGKVRAVVTRVVGPEELKEKSGDELDEIIHHELYFDEFEYNRNAHTAFRGRHKAEYLECMLFYCPQCRSMSGLCSKGNEFFCKDCGASVKINSIGFFEKIAAAENIPDTILEWSRKQLDYIKGFDFSGYTDKPVFSDNNITFSRVERAQRELFLGKGLIALYADRLAVCGQEFSLTDITMAVIGARKMSIFSGNEVYSVLVPFRTNLMKYMICGYHLRNKTLGIKEEFYGY